MATVATCDIFSPGYLNNFLMNEKILDWSKFQTAFSPCPTIFSKGCVLWGWKLCLWEKGKIAHNEQFLIFRQCFLPIW